MEKGRTLTGCEVQKGLRNVIFDGVMSQALSTLTGSVFLTAFALAMGASEFIVGILATIPFLANTIQIPAVFLVEKLRVRRSITVIASALSRSLWMLIALIPFIAEDYAVPLIILTLVTLSLLAAIGGCSWNSWMHDMVPKQSLGDFFSKRMMLSTAMGIVAALVAAVFISWWQSVFSGTDIICYSLLFGAGFIFGLAGVYIISTTPEPSMETQVIPKPSQVVKRPFEDSNFKTLIKFLASWNFAINLAMPFLTVYLMTNFGFSASVVSVFTVVSQITSMMFFRIWGSLCDRYSNTSVLKITVPAMLFISLLWASTSVLSGDVFVIAVVIGIHMLSGAASAGVNLATGNIGLKLAPVREATSYLAASSLFSSVFAGIAPLIGGIAIGFVGGWEYFFLFAFFAGILSIYYLRKLNEDGNAPNSEVVKSLMDELKTIASPKTVKSKAKFIGARLVVWK